MIFCKLSLTLNVADSLLVALHIFTGIGYQTSSSSASLKFTSFYLLDAKVHSLYSLSLKYRTIVTSLIVY